MCTYAVYAVATLTNLMNSTWKQHNNIFLDVEKQSHVDLFGQYAVGRETP